MTLNIDQINETTYEAWQAIPKKAKDLTTEKLDEYLQPLKRLFEQRMKAPQITVIVSQDFYETLVAMGIWEK